MSPLLLSLLLILALPAWGAAERYRVDLIVFIDLRDLSGASLPPRLPDADSALATDNEAALAAAGIRRLPDTDFGLQEEWTRLRNARYLRPLLKMAWEQTDPPSNRGPRLRIQDGAAMSVVTPDSLMPLTLAPLEGSVALHRSRYLHLDVNLRFTDDSTGSARQYRLQEQRRMRRDELHYLDGPKLRALARVRRAEPGTPLP